MALEEKQSHRKFQLPSSPSWMRPAHSGPSPAKSRVRPLSQFPIWSVALLAFLALFMLASPYLRSLSLPSDAAYLPFYAVSSLYRMTLAYVLALLFSIAFGYYAATRPLAEKIMVPLVDILQSVPILGFFPAAIFLFVALFPWPGIGIEMASVFLIFTSMAWNMALAAYEAMKSIPTDLYEVSRLSHLDHWTLFKKLYLPAAIPKLVYNSIISWAIGWYFLMASEIISFGSSQHSLPGLGTYLVKASAQGDWVGSLAGIFTLVVLVTVINLFFLRPLTWWSEKFKLDGSISHHLAKKSLGAVFFSWMPVSASMRHRPALLNAAFAEIESVAKFFRILHKPLAAAVQFVYLLFKRSVVILSVVGFLFLVFSILPLLQHPIPSKAAELPLLVLYSFLRIFAAYLLCLLWTIPAAVYLGLNARSEKWIAFFEVLASIPASAFFPLLIAAIVGFTQNNELAAILLIVTGMQWYIFFNVLGAIRILPKDYLAVGKAFNVPPVSYWKSVILPGIFPSLVTGSVTAWGQGWNALVVIEFIKFGSREFTVNGVGSFITSVVYGQGDSGLLVYGLVAITAAVLLMNQLVWKPLYALAYSKYRVD